MQFILITKHKHMYINSRIIQTNQKRFFPFFPPPLVNRYDIICILIAGSYKKKKKKKKKCFFSSFFNRYDIIWNSQIMALYLSYYYL